MTEPAFTIRIRGASSLVSREYLCPTHGVFDDLVTSPPPEEHACPACGTPSSRSVSAPAVHTQFVVSGSRGKNDAKPHHRSMDTRPLAEGMPLSEWKRERAKVWDEVRHERIKKMLE